MQRRIEKLEDRQLLAVGVSPSAAALTAEAAGAASRAGILSSAHPATVAQVVVTNIADGDSAPSVAKGTDFGSVLQGAAGPTRTYVVRNAGAAVLTLGAVSVPPGYALVHPLAAKLAPRASATFSVRLITTAAGVESGRISFATNDSDNNPFSFAVTGTVVAAVPQISVSGQGQNIPINSPTPSAANGTDFGSALQGAAAPTRTYTIRNPGGAPLILGAPTVPAGFAITKSWLGAVAPGKSDTLVIQLKTAAAGTFGGNVVFADTVPGQSPFSFAITGTVSPAPRIDVKGLQGLDIANGDTTPSATDGTNFGQAVFEQQVTRTFTILDQGAGSLALAGNPLVKITGPQASDFQVVQQPAATVAPGGSTTFAVEFTPRAMGTRSATVVITDNAAGVNATYQFWIAGTTLATPPVVNAAPAAGLRVRQVLPQYAGTGVYDTLYLPTDWVPGKLYPVIVEWAPNQWGAPTNTTGTPDDTQMGYYESGGSGFIWVTMPCINTTTNPPSLQTWWWGNGNYADPQGVQLDAAYAKAALIQILQNYGGNPAEVFATGFSRGAIATSYIGLSTDSMADIWLGFIPHAWEDANTADLHRTNGRATFITAGQYDGGEASSYAAYQYLTSQGDPTQFNVIPGIPHTDTWLRDDAAPTSLAIRQELRTWIATVIATHPGTHSICGTVLDGNGQPVPNVRIQSGDTHWTYTDANGNYQLAGLVNSSRTLTATLGQAVASMNVTMAGHDVLGENFTLVQGSSPSMVAGSAGSVANALAAAGGSAGDASQQQSNAQATDAVLARMG